MLQYPVQISVVELVDVFHRIVSREESYRNVRLLLKMNSAEGKQKSEFGMNSREVGKNFVLFPRCM